MSNLRSSLQTHVPDLTRRIIRSVLSARCRSMRDLPTHESKAPGVTTLMQLHRRAWRLPLCFEQSSCSAGCAAEQDIGRNERLEPCQPRQSALLSSSLLSIDCEL